MTRDKPGAWSYFPTTHWTTLLRPFEKRSPADQAAAERLFNVYRQPIVGYVRSLVRDPQEAEDIAHDFIVRLLNRGDLANVDRTKGRFRNYLGTSIRNFVLSRIAANHAQKREALNHAQPIESLAREPSSPDHAEREFTRQWWRATIDEAVARLRRDWEDVGYGELFADLEPRLWSKAEGSSVTAIAEKHAVSPAAISMRVYRLKDMFRAMLVAVVAETVGSEADAIAEIRGFLGDT